MKTEAISEPTRTREPIDIKGYDDRRLRKIASLCQGRTVLDLGYAQKPNPYFRGLERVGLDLEKPRTPSGYEEELVGNALDLGATLMDRKFDTVVAGELIEHMERPYDFLRHLRRFISDDGVLILTTPNPLSWPVVFIEWMSSRKFFYTKDHLYYFTPRWVVRMLEVTGYRIESIQPVGLLLPALGAALPCPVALSYQVIYVARPVRGKH